MSNGASQERRRERRKRIDLQVNILDAEQRTDTRLVGSCDELSLSGMFVRSYLLFELGEDLRVAFELPGGAHVSLRGRVIHVVRDGKRAGMGVTITQISDAHKAALAEYLKR